MASSPPAVAGHAAACTSGASLSTVIAQGMCTLDDLSLDFTDPQLISECYAQLG